MSGNTILDHLDAHARERADALAFDVAGRPRSFGALAAGARRAAAALSARGIGPGDRVAIVLGTVPETIEVLFGAQRLGALPMIVNPGLPAAAIARRVALVGARLVVDADNVKMIDDVDKVNVLDESGAAEDDATLRPGPEDIAYLQLTSGTTGEPHAAMIRHRSLLASLAPSRGFIQPTPRDAFVSWVPLHHDLGLVRFVFLPVYFGLPCHLLTPSLANLRAWLETITRVRATITSAPDFAYRLAARTVDPAGLDLSSLRIANNGGEPVRASTIVAFEERFRVPGVIRPGYGLAEATLGVSTIPSSQAVRVDETGAVSCGVPLEGIEVRVVDGAIEIRGEPVFAGYFDDAEATRAAFTEDGWLRTGDTGRLDADGHLWVLGRTRAMIKRAGALIAPREVEEAADRVAGVRFSAAVGVPRASDETEDVVVVVEARPDLDAAARADLVARVSAAVQAAIGVAPGRVLVGAARSIPITANGKIRHAVLRQAIVEGRWPSDG